MNKLITMEDFTELGKEIHKLFMADDIIGIDRLRGEMTDWVYEMSKTFYAPYIYNGMYRYFINYCSDAIVAIETDYHTQRVWDRIEKKDFIAEKFDYYINTYINNMPEDTIKYWYDYGYTLTMRQGEK